MIIYKGNKRIFDKVFEEPNTSAGDIHTLSITGVTAYSDLANVVLTVISNATGLANATLNINNLGAINIKKINQGGVAVNVESNWVLAKQVYSVIYQNNSFIIVSNSSSDLGTLDLGPDVLGLTSSSTAQEIENALGGSEYFINDLLQNKILTITESENRKIMVNYFIKYTLDEITQITLEFINNGDYYKQTYTVDPSTGLITGVTVETSNLLLRDANNLTY